MKKVTIAVERAENNFSAYVREVDGIAVTGDSLDTIRSSMTAAISDYIGTCRELDMEVPAEFSEGYELSFELDIRSLLTIYEDIFTKSALERLTGINRKQLWHYAHGKSVPRPAPTSCRIVSQRKFSVQNFICEWTSLLERVSEKGRTL